jgi:hypothetical protein
LLYDLAPVDRFAICRKPKGVFENGPNWPVLTTYDRKRGEERKGAELLRILMGRRRGGSSVGTDHI